MTQNELTALLNTHEWRDVEFKEAQREVSRSAYETVSRVCKHRGRSSCIRCQEKWTGHGNRRGVLDVDKVQSDFLTTLRQSDKISVIVNVREELHKHDDADLLIFYVPEVHRSHKPVFLNGDIRRSFVRSGGSDVRCSDNERNRFLLDAAVERHDGQIVDFNLDTAFDSESVKWYRAVYEGRPGNRSYASLADADFLNEMGLLVESEGRSRPSRAAILLFGTNTTFRQLLPRPVVDCQRFGLTRDTADTGERWIDRLVLDENLVRAWQSLIDWYQRLADRPFRVDPASLQRDDAPPDYRAFRESMVNLLIHQDYSDHSRKPEIRHYPDQTIFWNPGDAFPIGVDLLEPGEKEVCNPRIVTVFRRIGLSENAGWGLRDVFRIWQELGNVPRRITNDKGHKCFELVLLKEEMLSAQQRLFQASLGVRLTDQQARAFAFACREREVTLSQIKAVTGLSGPDAVALAEHLTTQMLIKPVEPGRRYVLAEQLEEHSALTDQVDSATGRFGSDQAQRLRRLTENQWKIVMLCDVPRSVADMMGELGLTHRTFFRRNHLEPLLRAGIVAMTNPENPRAANQR